MPENFPSVLPQLCCSGLALFIGVVVVPLLALLFSSARKRQQLRATLANIPLRSIATLRPGQGLVRLKGTVSQVPNPVSPFLDIAVLRVTVDVRERYDEDTRHMDRLEVRPFLLDDGSGTVWVDPTGMDRFLIGKEFVPVEQERVDALRAVGLPAALAGGNIQVWAVSAGQEVNVVGTVQEKDGQMIIGKARGHPLVVSLSDLAELTTQAGRQAAMAWAVWVILGAIGLCMLGVFVVTLANALHVLLAGG